MASDRVRRRLAAILSADVVGYSRLMRENEADTLAAVRALRTELWEPTLASHGGRLVKTSGDGFLIEFGSAVDAVEAALAVRDALAQSESGLVLRIGINLGDVVVDGDDLLGDGVNVAARLEAIAQPGDIYVAGNVHEQTADKVAATFVELGPQALKNIDRPVHVYAIRRAAPLGDSRRAGPRDGGSGRPVIAVLPLTNMSTAADDEYFSDGLTEDIITELSRFRDCRVIARNSTFQYKGRAIDVAQVGRELNARYVVEGSVRRAGTQLRITAQLVEAATGTHLWAERYDRGIADVFAVQDELTRTIAATLGVRLQGAALERALARSPADLDAYDCVLRARRFTVTLDAPHHAEARDLLEKAIALDPGYADAHALLANVYLGEHRFDFNPRPDPLGRALIAARRAIELDPQNATAHCWLAIVHFFRRENERFFAEANLALALNPNDPEVLADVGHYVTYIGEHERGCDLMRQAIELNPLHPGWFHFAFARLHYARREYRAVLADIEAVDMPDFYWTWLLRTAALGQLGDADGAAKSIAQLRRIRPNFDARAEVMKWNAAYDDFQHLVEGLAKAGLS